MCCLAAFAYPEGTYTESLIYLSWPWMVVSFLALSMFVFMIFRALDRWLTNICCSCCCKSTRDEGDREGTIRLGRCSSRLFKAAVAACLLSTVVSTGLGFQANTDFDGAVRGLIGSLETVDAVRADQVSTLAHAKMSCAMIHPFIQSEIDCTCDFILRYPTG